MNHSKGQRTQWSFAAEIYDGRMTATLAEELVLLAYADDGTPNPDSSALDYGLAGAVLVELAAAGRIGPADGKVRIADPAPTGHPALDHGLTRITGYGRPATPGELVDAIRGGLRDIVLDALVARGILRRAHRRFRQTKFPATTGAQKTATRAHLTAFLDGEQADAHTLAALAVAAGLTASTFPDADADTVKRRLATRKEPWPATAVRELLEIQTSTATMFIAGS